jgi:hypothetical protein
MMFVVLALSLVFRVGSSTSEAEEQETKEKTVVLVVVGKTDSALLERIGAFVEKHFYCAVKSVSKEALKDTPETEAEESAKLLEPGDLCVVELINVPQDVGFGQAVFVSHHVALLNIWGLKPGDGSKQEDVDEQYGRRVEKEVVQLTARLLGLQTCPLPRCALSDWSSEEELDSKARELCPPCLAKAMEALKRKGMDVPE